MKLMYFALNKKILKAIIVQLLMMVNVDYGNGVNDGYNINIKIIIITKMILMTTMMIVVVVVVVVVVDNDDDYCSSDDDSNDDDNGGELVMMMVNELLLLMLLLLLLMTIPMVLNSSRAVIKMPLHINSQAARNNHDL